VYSNFKNKEDLFLALLETIYSQEMSELREMLGSSDVPSEERLGDFVGMIRNEMERIPENWGTLYLEFCLYALRNPAARARLNELEQADALAVADLIEGERQGLGIDPLVRPENTARIINALFRGIGLMRTLDPDADNEELLKDAMSFVARGLGVEP